MFTKAIGSASTKADSTETTDPKTQVTFILVYATLRHAAKVSYGTCLSEGGSKKNQAPSCHAHHFAPCRDVTVGDFTYELAQEENY